MVKLDIGCGPNKKDGFLGVDQYAMEGVDVVHDVRQRWPWEDGEVEEVHCSHFLEHLTGQERVTFFNELYRVLKPQGKATIITPHWCSERAYGDFTHQWPPIGTYIYAYINKAWRDLNAPHNDASWAANGYTCDFDATWGYAPHPSLVGRNQEFQAFAFGNLKEAIQDLHATIIKR